MKRKYIALLGLMFMLACGQEQATKTNVEHIDADTLVEKVETETQPEVKLFDMHPEPIFEEEQEDYLQPNIKYFTGEIAGDKIELILNQLTKPNQFVGHYLYNSNGACFEIKAEWSESKDSIFITRYKDYKVREEFKGACTDNLSEINGIWIKGENQKPFSLKAVKNTPEQAQVFINLEKGIGLHLTQKGIRMEEGYSGMERFNNFMFTNQMGAAYDFGQEWSHYGSQVFEDQNEIIYSSIDLNNSEETIFDTPPSGPDDFENSNVIGTEYSAYGDWIVQVINDGESSFDTIKINENRNLEPVMFRKWVVFMDERGNNLVYQWNSANQKFEQRQ
ncbi:MAG: hypothetical protein ACWA41_09800 [Putridiphycobacter sp.]